MPRPPLRPIALAAALAIGWSLPASAATLEVGAGKRYPLPSAAALAARDGDRIVIAPGHYADCAVWRADNLTIEGAGPDATVIAGKTCGYKALFIIDGGNVTVRNLTLAHARAPDFNGAGIRAEGGDLTVDHVRFLDNQDGILSTGAATAVIRVSDSEFLGNGSCAGSGCAHGIYAGAIALLQVERSRFFETQAGHHIKSRALRTEVLDCDLADGADGTSSYAIDVPNGGAVLVRGTRIQKGPRSENRSAAIMIGAEGVTHPTPGIVIERNQFTVEGDYSAYLADNRSVTPALLRGNTLHGSALGLRGPGSVD